jgi:hypothetical protein
MLKNKTYFFLLFASCLTRVLIIHTSHVGARNHAKTIFHVKSLWPGLVVDTRYSRNVMDVDWGLVVKLALAAKVTRRANKVIGIYDRSH